MCEAAGSSLNIFQTHRRDGSQPVQYYQDPLEVIGEIVNKTLLVFASMYNVVLYGCSVLEL